ncbi:hypothetical protein, partial [Sphingopyxis sp. LC81]|uniref:hypothetical protein n=1 Tax=Sphingopyxis sp. LC81 TaxID=1502850 RepID=UPI00056033D2
DYGSTLSEIAKRLVSIERKPAQQMPPEDLGARTAADAAGGRRAGEGKGELPFRRRPEWEESRC